MPDDTLLYTSSAACRAAGISDGSLRNYCARGRYGRFYGPFLSAGASPPAGQARQFSESDIALFRYIKSRTSQGAPHETIAAELAAGALADWQPPEPPAMPHVEARQAAPGRQPEELPASALVVFQQSAAQLAGVMSAQFEAARAEAAALQVELRTAEARAVKAETEAAHLAAELARARRPFWRRWFAG